jgi:hypothetical protein
VNNISKREPVAVIGGNARNRKESRRVREILLKRILLVS